MTASVFAHDLEALPAAPGETSVARETQPADSPRNAPYAGLLLAFTMLLLGLATLMTSKILLVKDDGAGDAPNRALAAEPKSAEQKFNVDFSQNRSLSSAAWSEPWHEGACPDTMSWANFKLQCDGCKALVKHQSYGSTCDGYCKGQGLQCLGAWEEVNNDCETKGWFQCSEPIWGTSDAICECTYPCSQTGNACTESKCCGDAADSCFETAFGTAVCMPSCTPGVDGTCRQPFEHPLGQARQTWMWPDIACVVGAGQALVKPDVFRSKYNSDCTRFCQEGAGKTVAVAGDDFYKWWKSVDWTGAETEEQVCPGAEDASRRGVKCSCSFPDRL